MTTPIQMYMGRNIGKDEQGYFIAFSDKDTKRYADKNKVAKAHFTDETKALSQMKFNLRNGWTWFDAHNDPTI